METGNHPQYIVIHHTATPLDNNPRTFDAVKRYHVGKGWGDIGYHWFIERDGTLFTGRAENIVGAHCYQDNLNYKSIGICLEGMFDKEDPTPEQMKTLKDLVLRKMKEYTIPPENVVPHRKYATYKSCPGTRFTDKMVVELCEEGRDINFINRFICKIVVDTTNGELFAVDKDGDLHTLNSFPTALRKKMLELGIVQGLSHEDILKFNKKLD